VSLELWNTGLRIVGIDLHLGVECGVLGTDADKVVTCGVVGLDKSTLRHHLFYFVLPEYLL
jgi:hypothetical protein